MATHKVSEENVTSPFILAFNKTEKARVALDTSELAPINLDPQLSVTTVMSAIPRLLTIRDEIAESLPTIDMAQFDKLQTYAHALYYAQTLYLSASEPAEELPALVARGAELRDQLLADVTTLARRNLVDPKVLSELKGGVGYLNVSADIGVLVNTLRARWNDIKDKSAVQPSELDEAWQIYERIAVGYAARAQQPMTVAAAADDRARAFTLLVRAYDQARRAITFLRWDDNDVEKFAPSLWAGRGGRPGTSVNKPADPGIGEPTPTTPTPEPVVTPSTPTAPTTPVTPPANGMPGGSPFAHN